MTGDGGVGPRGTRAVPSGALDGIHPDLAGTLVRLATLPDRRDAAWADRIAAVLGG